MGKLTEIERVEDLVFFAIGLSGQFFCSFVFMQCWGWFIVPLGVVSINLWHAIGLLAMSDLFGFGNTPETKDERYMGYLIRGWFVPAIVLAIGFCIKGAI